jgi:hypothetical protein
MRRVIGDAAISMGALLVLILVLAGIDARVREQIQLRVAPGTSAAQMAGAEATIRRLTTVIVDAVRDQSIEHAPLVLFVIAGIVLLLFMLRT